VIETAGTERRASVIAATRVQTLKSAPSANLAPVTVAILGGAALIVTPMDSIKAPSWSAVINGAIAAPVVAVTLLDGSEILEEGAHRVRGVVANAIGRFGSWPRRRTSEYGYRPSSNVQRFSPTQR
jgi:hypothetical protein